MKGEISSCSSKQSRILNLLLKSSWSLTENQFALRGSKLVGCQIMARVLKWSVAQTKELVHWKDNLLFQQRVVKGVSSASIASNSHPGSRDQHALGHPTVMYKNEQQEAKGKKKSLSDFFIILLIFITLNIFHSNALILVSGCDSTYSLYF